jgi:hypothetical protein
MAEEDQMTTQENTIPINQTNARAEDGFQRSPSWNAFCEGILIPLASLGAVFLIMLGVMLISN